MIYPSNRVNNGQRVVYKYWINHDKMQQINDISRLILYATSIFFMFCVQ